MSNYLKLNQDRWNHVNNDYTEPVTHEELEEAKKDIGIWKRRYEELKKQTKDFIEAIRKAPELVKSFIRKVLHTEKDVPKHQQHKKHERTI